MTLQDDIKAIAKRQEALESEISAIKAEIETLKPSPTAISRYRLLQLLLANGATPEGLAAATQDEQLAPFWLMFNSCQEVDKEEQATVDGLAALEALEYLPEGGAEDVLEAWD